MFALKDKYYISIKEPFRTEPNQTINISNSQTSANNQVAYCFVLSHISMQHHVDFL